MKPEFKALQWASICVWETSLCWGLGCRTGGCFIAPLTRAWWVLCWAINYDILGLCREENPQVTGTSSGATLDEIPVPSNPSDRMCLQQMQRLCSDLMVRV